MALAHGRSSLTTDRLTHHTLTQVTLLRQWLDVDIEVKGHEGQPGRVTMTGVSWSPAR
jgi:RNA 3'-terminal phosphate cyclase